MMSAAVNAQQWTVFELPASVDDIPAKVQQQFGCSYEELTEKHNITHLKITGKDIPYSWNRDGKNALHALAAKAEVIDLSEVGLPEDTEWGFHTKYWDGPDVHYVMEYMGTEDLDSLRRFIFPKAAHQLYGIRLSYCDKLEEVVWPDNVVELSYNMFESCPSLKTIEIPATVKELPDQCFKYCGNLQSVTLHEGITAIGEECFRNCEKLTGVSVPSTVTTLGGRSFVCCYALKDVTLREGLREISWESFQYDTCLTTLHIPSTVTKIGPYVFSDCKNLSSINIPDAVTSIDGYAFHRCTALKRLTLPQGIDSIGHHCFAGSGLEEFTMPDKDILMWGQEGDQGGLFEDCKSLKRVHLSTLMTRIPAYTFAHCDSLVEVNIPRGVRRIEHDAFWDCSSLPTPTLPDELTFLGYSAFRNCRFDHITLPEKLEEIQNECFRTVPLRSIDIPASVKEICSYAFEHCDSLRSVTLHEGLQHIQGYVFNNCGMLEEVKLPNSLRVLGEWVFCGCKKLRKYVQPPLINVVPNHICAGCDSLETVILHDRVTRIEGNAFEYSKKLTHIDLPEGLETIGSWSFIDCPLKEINIPSSVRVIDERAFAGGDYERVVLPEGVQRVEARAFYSKKLRHVDFPSTISLMGEWALQGDGPACDSLIIRTATPPYNRGNNVSRPHYGPIYVPALSVQAYKACPDYKDLEIKPLPAYSNDKMVIARSFSTDSTWFPVINNVDLIITHKYDYNFQSGHLHVGSNMTWPLRHLRYDYRQAWQNNDWGTPWENKQPTATLVNDGTMTPQSMEMNLRYEVNQWFFFTPPFDMKASDLVCNDPRTPYVLRTFDGTQRAIGNHDKVWTDVAKDDTLRTGQGYILRYGEYRVLTHFTDYKRGEQWSNISSDIAFNMHNSTPLTTLALNNGNVMLELKEYKSEFQHNSGWNFVANPYMAYFDIQQLDCDAPILVSNRYNSGTLDVVSPIDDDYVLKPLQAFLIQRGTKQKQVVFHPQGRQHEFPAHREEVNSARSLRRALLRSNRVVYNISLRLQTASEEEEQSVGCRLVVTPNATEGYDQGQDAPFLTMDDAATALYTRSGGLRYSLNEQPPTAESVQLGMNISQAGTYTISISMKGDPNARYDNGFLPSNLRLKDNETGTVTDIIDEDYTFTVTEPATVNNRFTLLLNDGITAVQSVATDAQPDRQTYDLQGRRVSTPQHGIYIKNGKKLIK